MGPGAEGDGEAAEEAGTGKACEELAEMCPSCSRINAIVCEQTDGYGIEDACEQLLAVGCNQGRDLRIESTVEGRVIERAPTPNFLRQSRL